MDNKCPRCGGCMTCLSSSSRKLCSCGYEEDWNLKPGQKSVLINGLVGENDKNFIKERKK